MGTALHLLYVYWNSVGTKSFLFIDAPPVFFCCWILLITCVNVNCTEWHYAVIFNNKCKENVMAMLRENEQHSNLLHFN